MKGPQAEHPMYAPDQTVAEIVTADYRSAKVFAEHGIDFCCGGQATLAKACAEKGADLAAMTAELDAATSARGERSLDYAAWQVTLLADYIVQTHHAYLKENTGRIVASAKKIASVHGAPHPEAIAIASLFETTTARLTAHMKEEEEIGFPAMKRADAARQSGSSPQAQDVRTIERCVKEFIREHEEIGGAMHEIRRLAKDYAIPGDVCNAFMVVYRDIEEFEGDLHKHVHLENNILFPKAARLRGGTPL
ncbi:MAG: iron-sulfur cluster repair di-iron protein [Elusimicrobia bacterium]|nr:iron-sulfur cluster repair di-iron protein [Elusimicrobiota bacterium]